jgi:hypothetical protein
MIKLYINGALVDINRSGFDIRLNRKLTEVQNFNERSGEFSFTLTLPKTKVNNQIFEYANEPDQPDKFRRPGNFAAELFINGDDILTGFFKLTSVTPQGYAGNLYGLSISWADDLESVNLRELVWSVPYTGAGGGATNIDGYNLAINSPIRFPLISYFPWPNTVLVPDRTLDSNSLFTIDQLPPEISVKETFKRVFAAKGWEVSGSFFSEDWFKSLHIPFSEGFPPPLNYATLGGLLSTKFGFVIPLNFVLNVPPDQSAAPADNRGYEFLQINDLIQQAPTVSEFDGSGLGDFEINYNGEFLIEIEIRGLRFIKSTPIFPGGAVNRNIALLVYDTNDPLTIPYTDIDNYLQGFTSVIDNGDLLGFYDLSNGYAPENKDGFLPIVLINDYTDQVIAPAVGEFERIQGDASNIKIQFPMNLKNPVNLQFVIVTWFNPGTNLVGTYRMSGGAFLRINQDKDADLHPGKFLPDITAKEFVKSFINDFNLWFTTDDINKRISFFTFDEFHKPDAQGVNLDCFAPIDSGTLSPNNPKQEIQLNRKFDEKDIKIPGEFGNFTRISKNVYSQGVKVLNSFFAASVSLPAVDNVSNQSFNAITINAAGVLDQDSFTGEFIGGFVNRLLQYVGVLTGATIRVQMSGVVDFTTIGLNTFNGAPPADDLTQTDINLMFNNTPGLPPGLYDRFYRTWVELLERSHIIELTGKLTPAEFRKMTLDTPIIYNSEIYFLLEINGFSALTGDAKIKLIKKRF